MTTIPTTALSPHIFPGRAVRGASDSNRGFLFAAAIYLAVALVELSIIVLAVPGIADISQLSVTVP